MLEDEVSFWARIAGGTAAVFGALFGVWRHTHKRIDGAYAALEGKASLEEMNRQRDNIAKLFDHQRQDREQLMKAMGDTNDLLREIHLALTRELGERPTRVEVARMLAGGRAS